MYNIAGLSLHLTVLPVLLIIVAFDLAVRWACFHRIESVAIDIALFSSGYSLVETLHAQDQGERFGPWQQRFAADAICLLLLTLLHVWLRTALEKKIRVKLETIKHGQAGRGGMTRTLRNEVISLAEPLIQRSILVAISVPEISPEIRTGKRQWRDDVKEFLEKVAPTVSLSESDLMLPRRWRLGSALAFTALGLVALFAPIVTIPIAV